MAKTKVIGCDVAKDFVILYDGKGYYHYGTRKTRIKRVKVKEISYDELKDLIANSTVILEQTGTYGIRFANIFSDLGAEVLIADGKAINRFRRGGNKDDFLDAKAIREMYFDKRFTKHINPFHKQRFTLRTLIRHHKRLQKELTRSVNRVKQHLAHLFPEENYHELPRHKLFKSLEEIKQKLLQHPDAISIVAIHEITTIQNILKAVEDTKKEIESIVLNHDDYFILKSFGLGNLQIASLIAYYWDINLFKTKDAFISYVLMGVKKEQSGSSVYSHKTDKSRTEVKGYLYLFFLKCHQIDNPLKPLAEFMKLKEKAHKKRYIKFLDKILEMIYYALKERKQFGEIIEKILTEKRTQLLQIKEKISQKETKKDLELYRRLLERYRNTSDLLLVCEDISTLLKNRKSAVRVECQDYYKEELTGLYAGLYKRRYIHQEESNENDQSRTNQGAPGETSSGRNSLNKKRVKDNTEQGTYSNNGEGKRNKRSELERFRNVQEGSEEIQNQRKGR